MKCEAMQGNCISQNAVAVDRVRRFCLRTEGLTCTAPRHCADTSRFLAGDKNVVDALKKIRQFRNAHSHLNKATTRSMASVDFKASWAEVVASLESILSTFPEGDVQVRISFDERVVIHRVV